MQTLAFRRIAQFSRYVFLTSWRRSVTPLVIVTLSLLFFQLILFHDAITRGEVVDAERQKFLIHNYSEIFFFIIPLTFYVAAAHFQQGQLSKQTRLQMLMVPVRVSEKYLVYFLKAIVVSLLVLFFSLWFADLFRMLIEPLMGEGRIGLTVPTLLGSFSRNLSWESLLTGLAFFLPVHAFYVLGGCFFRKNPLLLTLVTQIVIGLVLAIVGLVGNIFFKPYRPDVYIEFEKIDPNLIFNTFRWASIGFSLLLYFLSYRAFSRQQVLGRTFINL